MDTGSDTSLIRKDVATELDLHGPSREIRFGTFDGNQTSYQVDTVDFKITSIDGTAELNIESALAVPNLNIAHRRVNLPTSKALYPHLANMEIPAVDSSLVTVLLGQDVPEVHETLGVRKPQPGHQGPIAIKTLFGWCVVGKLSDAEVSVHYVNKFVNHIATSTEEISLDRRLELFWTTEAVRPNETQLMSSEDKEAVAMLKSTINYQQGRYEVGLMWRNPHSTLPNNRSAAVRRLLSLENRLKKDATFAVTYANQIEEYVTLGHAKRLSIAEANTTLERTWYLPHHGVVNQNRPNKVRVVFDASATFHGTSLNSKLMKGPDLLTSLIGVLLRFRRFPIPLSADIEKMYLQVKVPAQDTSSLRFL